jgi:hypothetical protein
MRVKRRAAEADDQGKIIGVALLLELLEQWERRDRRVVTEREAARVVVLGA